MMSGRSSAASPDRAVKQLVVEQLGQTYGWWGNEKQGRLMHRGVQQTEKLTAQVALEGGAPNERSILIEVGKSIGRGTKVHEAQLAQLETVIGMSRLMELARSETTDKDTMSAVKAILGRKLAVPE